MAANHEGSAVPSGNPTTSFTVAFPFATDTNHKCFLAVVSRDHTSGDAWPSVTDNEPSGNAWVRLAGTADRKASFWYRVATVDTWNYTVTVSGCLGSSAGALHIFSGANGYRVWGFETNASGDESHAGFTPLQNNSYVNLSVFDCGGANAPTGFSATGVGSFATWQTKQSTGGSGCSVASAGAFQTGGPSAVGATGWSQTNSTTYSLLWELTEDKHYEVNPADAGSVAITGTDATLTYGAGAGGYTVAADAGSVTVTGTAAGALKGSMVAADAGSAALTGTAAGLLFGRMVAAEAGSVAVAGVDAGLLVGHQLAADAGIVAVAGADAALSRGYPVAADAGSVAAAGAAAGILVGHVVAAETGAVSVQGTDAALELGHVLVADAGAVVVTGTDATLAHGVTGAYTLVADPGAVSATGTAAGTLAARVVTAESGSVFVSGTDAAPLAGRLVVADVGSVAVSGTDAGALAGRRLVAEAGALTLSGADAAALAGRRLAADSGSLAWAGADAALTYSGTSTRTLQADAGSVAVAGVDAGVWRYVVPAAWSEESGAGKASRAVGPAGTDATAEDGDSLRATRAE